MPARVGVERLLRAVAVVRVVVDDQDVFAALRECGRRDGDVVEQAEPHRASGRAWWPGGRKARRGVALAGGECAAAASPAPAARTAAGHEPADMVVSRSMDPPPCSASDSRRSTCRVVCTRVISSTVASRGGSGVTKASVSPPTSRGLGDAGVHGLQPRRALGVPAAGIVVGEARVCAHEQHHSPFAVASRHAATVGKAAVTPQYPACSDEGGSAGRGDPRLRSRRHVAPELTPSAGGAAGRIGPFRSDADVARLTMGTDAPPARP